MKSHFIRLLNYDLFANTKIAELLMERAATGKPVELMAHLLAAQQIWVKRLKGLPAPLKPLWPEATAEEIMPIVNANYLELLAYFDSLQPNDFDRVIAYTNSVGYCENSVSDILTHLINHGTHHRAQIGTLLKIDGETLPMLDYVLYIRNLNQTV
ncbi:putative damage-inducible protein DinB [Mucilaginibacter sp. UYP25]|uniref:DinB family protein n=1 Tax=unclassified Mucilaginibacter TaxID=2617802 RepID=UPI003396E128